jgi:hypothetical protein
MELPAGTVPLPGNSRPLCTVKHTITRYRITLEAFVVDRKLAKTLAADDGRWFTLPRLKRLSFPSAHRKILTALTAAAGSDLPLKENSRN